MHAGEPIRGKNGILFGMPLLHFTSDHPDQQSDSLLSVIILCTNSYVS